MVAFLVPSKRLGMGHYLVLLDIFELDALALVLVLRIVELG